MGITDYDDVQVSEIKLDRNDRILLYTDGLTERFNNDKEAYGLERLFQHFGAIETDDPREIIEVMIKNIEEFSGGRPADDDLALLVCTIE